MSLIVEASRSIFAGDDGPALLKAVTTWQRSSITPDVGTWQAVVVSRVCALCTSVIWLFENLYNSVVLAQRVCWPQSQSQFYSYVRLIQHCIKNYTTMCMDLCRYSVRMHGTILYGSFFISSIWLCTYKWFDLPLEGATYRREQATYLENETEDGKTKK